MLEVMLTAMAREFQEDRSLCPKTYRAMRAVVERSHEKVDRGRVTTDQEESREAKATITFQNCISTGKAVALSLCAQDHHSPERGKTMSEQKDSSLTPEHGQ